MLMCSIEPSITAVWGSLVFDWLEVIVSAIRR
jgi:hypothetical protein